MKRLYIILLVVALVGQNLQAATPMKICKTGEGNALEPKELHTPYRFEPEGLSTSYPFASTKPRTLPRFGNNNHSFWQQRTVQMSLGLVGTGLVLTTADLQTRSLRTDYLPTFRNHFDDYMQFAPGAVMAAMKLCGLESRNDLPRMAASAGASMATYLSVVYLIKYGTGRLRPDGSTHNSFPSGHTANAFCMATMLHKEYGYLSPWVSIAGYTLATTTGIGRSLNNRHWLSDIVVGAGLGILSTEAAYWFMDRLFKDRWLARPDDDNLAPVKVGRKPSFVGIGIGGNMLVWDHNRYHKLSHSGVAFNVEGAWFFTPSLGVGGQAKVGQYANIVGKDVIPNDVVKPKPVNNMALMGGLYYTHHLPNERWQLGVKALAGVAKGHYQWFEYIAHNENAEQSTIEMDTKEHFSASAGIWARYIVGNNLGIRAFADYNYIRSGYSITHPGDNSPSHNTATYMHPQTIGIAVDVML